MNWALINTHGICENIIVAENFETANDATPYFLTPISVSTDDLKNIKIGFKYDEVRSVWIDPSLEEEE